MATISQRELRNDNARIVREVEMGHRFTVTRRGVPVAVLAPVSDDAGLPMVRAASKRPQFRQLPRRASPLRSEQILDDLRGDR